MQLWNDRHLGEDRQCTEQQLAGQVNSVLRRNVFSDLELAEFKRIAVPSSHLVPPTKGNADCTNQHAPFDVDFNCSQPTDDMAMTDGSSVNDSVSILPSELMPIKDKLSSLCQELKDTNKLQLPTLQSVLRNKLRAILSEINQVLPFIPTNSIDQLHHLMYCTAVLVTEMCGYEVHQSGSVPPHPWKHRLLLKLKQLRADLSRLNELKHNRLHNHRTVLRLHNQYHLDTSTDLNTTCEVIHQKMQAYSCRLKRYESRQCFNHHNRMFNSRRHQFFNLLNIETQTVNCPPVDATLEFWKQLWGSPCEHDPTALPNLEDILKISDIPTMEELIITPELFAYAVSRIKNWKSTGLDCLHGYWIKHLTSLHDHLHCYLMTYCAVRRTPLLHGFYREGPH